MKKLFTLFVCLGAGAMIWAQTLKVTGTVVDEDNGEPLIGVSVLEKGTTNGIITDLDGNFSLNVAENAILQFSYVGYATEEMKAKKNFGTIEMKGEAVALTDVLVTGQLAKQQKTPVAVSQVTALEIEERLGGQEFPEVLKNTPGVHANGQGGGWGDSEIWMRGFDNTNVATMVNGVPMNDMENGSVYWSNWQGLGDVTSVMQTQRGMGASKVSAPSVGGTINIVTKGIDAKKGGFLSYAMGNDGYNKVAFSVSTGLMKNGWAITVLGSRTWGNGYIQGTNFEGYTYFANISKRINDHHQLSLTGFGAPQWHYQRAARYGALTLSEWEKVKKYMKDGMDYRRFNPTYGYDNYGNQKSSDYNQYHKPQISLNHVWQIDHKSSLSTALYTSIGRGFGYTGENGAYSSLTYSDFRGAYNGELLTTFRRDDGTFDYGAIQDINAASSYGSELVMTESRNYHNWYGLVSNYSNRFLDCLDLYTGIDFRYYQGIHQNVIVDLYNGDYYIDAARKQINAANNSAAADPEWLNEHLGVGDICYRDYTGHVFQAGCFAQLEYSSEAWTAFVNAAFNNTTYWREDRYYYDAEHARSETMNFVGGNIKGGVNYNINSHNNIFLNAGYISRAPQFSYGVFMTPSTSNVTNPDARNEQIASVEIGYGFKNEYVNFTANAYFTEWMDKAMTKATTMDNQESGYINMTGVNAQHMGLEFELKANPTKWLELSAMLSLGRWKWDSDSVVGYVYDDHGQPLQKSGEVASGVGAEDHACAIINMKGINVGGQAQTTANLGVTFKPFKGFRIGAEYTLYDRNYAYYQLSGSNLTVGKTMNVVAPWKIPTGGQLDMRASYTFDFGKCRATLSGNINNVLDQLYITKAYNPSTASTSADYTVDPQKVYFFYAFGRTYNIRLKIAF